MSPGPPDGCPSEQPPDVQEAAAVGPKPTAAENHAGQAVVATDPDSLAEAPGPNRSGQDAVEPQQAIEMTAVAGGARSDQTHAVGHRRSPVSHETSVSEKLVALRMTSRPDQGGFEMHWAHFTALFIKRLNISRRDFRALCFQLLIPVLMVVVGLALVKAGSPTDSPMLEMSTAMLNTNARVDKFVPTGPNRCPWTQFKASSGSPASSADIMALLNSLPQGNVTTAGLGFSSAQFASLADPNEIVTAQVQPQRTWQQMSAQLLSTKAGRYRESAYMAYAWTRDDTLFLGQDPVGLSDNVYTYSALVNTTWFHAAPTVVNIANSGILQRVSGNTASRIVVRNFPLPLTMRQANLLGAFFASAVRKGGRELRRFFITTDAHSCIQWTSHDFAGRNYHTTGIRICASELHYVCRQRA
jgi:hypothetical protein